MQQNFTEEHKSFLASMKKKLFIVFGYLMVSAALLVLVSYGQYKIRIVGELDMPQAATMQAQITLTQSIENHSVSVELNQFLVDLLPDDSAKDFQTSAAAATDDSAAQQTAVRHKIDVVIHNKATKTVPGEDGTTTTITEASEVDMQYTLRIFAQGRLPMQFVLVDHQDNNKDYLSKKIGGAYYFYDYTSETGEDGVETRTETVEKVFEMSATGEISQRYSIYAGWDNTNSENEEAIFALNDASFRKEVSVLELRADVINKPQGMNIFDEPEAQAQRRMEIATKLASTLPTRAAIPSLASLFSLDETVPVEEESPTDDTPIVSGAASAKTAPAVMSPTPAAEPVPAAESSTMPAADDVSPAENDESDAMLEPIGEPEPEAVEEVNDDGADNGETGSGEAESTESAEADGE